MTATTLQAPFLVNRGDLTSLGITSPAALEGGKKRINTHVMEVPTTSLDEVGDVVMLCALPPAAVVHSIKLASDDLDSDATPALAWNVGLFPKQDSLVGVAKNATAYASAITLGQSATALTEYAFEQRDISKMGQTVWQDAGDSNNPGGEYFLGLSVATPADVPVAGTLAWQVEYSVD